MYEELCEVEFEGVPQLRNIEASAFSGCSSLCSICLPRFLDTLGGSAFLNSGIRTIRVAEGNDHFRVCGDFLVTKNETSLVWYFGVGSNVTVLGEIRSLAVESFPSIRRIVFEGDSELRRIESRAFSNCDSLRAICIPSPVERIDGSAFAKSGIREIRVAEGNNHFMVSGAFLLNSDGTSLIRYFGNDSIVKIRSEIEVISAGSFDSCLWVRALKFEGCSKVRVIESRAFQECRMLWSMSLPPSTEVLELLCFNQCVNLREVEFEEGSTLRLIESESFRGCTSLKSIAVRKPRQGKDGVDVSGVSGVDILWFE
jgi:hypothetical protein